MNLSVFSELTPDGDLTWAQSLTDGLVTTVQVAALAWVVAMIVGSLVGVARTTESKWLVRAGNAWVELFRNIPLIVQFFVWFFVVPGLFPAVKAKVVALDPDTHQFWTAVVCLGLFTSARIAEQVRAGIQSLPRGQRMAALALGLTEWQAYRHVRLPMAYRIIIPPLTSETMNLLKNSSVAYSIGLAELFFRTREMGEMTFQYFQAFGAATVAYVSIALIANRIMALVERRTRVPGFVGGH